MYYNLNIKYKNQKAFIKKKKLLYSQPEGRQIFCKIQKPMIVKKMKLINEIASKLHYSESEKSLWK